MSPIATQSHSLDWYLTLKFRLVGLGYENEIQWSENLKPVADALAFWVEFAWVVLNSGMKNQVAEKIWKKVCPAVIRGEGASSVFGHKGKCAAIDGVYERRDEWFQTYQQAGDKLSFLETMPWIGGITKYHLAKNYGHDCAKPDRHLVRIAGEEGTHSLCARLAIESGDRIATVDLVIWRAANLGLA